MELPRFNVVLNENRLDDGVKEILNVVRVEWATPSTWNQLKSKIFTDGITNKLIGYFLAEAPRDVIIFKIYGPRTEDMIDRSAEIQTMKFLHERGMGPKIYGIFNNGIVYEFIPGKTLTSYSCRDPQIYPLVAETMAKLHSIPIDQVPSSNKSAFWDKLNIFLRLADEILDKNPTIREKYAEFGLTRDWMCQKTKYLKNLIENSGMPYAFCHNDILLGNIVYDEVNSSVSFIDYEYAFVNYGPFDVANHFNEFAGVEEPDFSLCPDQSFMILWVQEYLKHWKTKRLDSEVDVNQFMTWVNLCIPLSHLFWIVWTVVQAQNSIISFDYITYGKDRFLEFEKLIKHLQTESRNFT